MTFPKFLGNKVLVEKLIPEVKKKAVLILAEDSAYTHLSAEVKAVGMGLQDSDGKYIPLPVKVGDKILVSKHCGQEFKHDDKLYYLISIGDVIAIKS